MKKRTLLTVLLDKNTAANYNSDTPVVLVQRTSSVLLEQVNTVTGVAFDKTPRTAVPNVLKALPSTWARLGIVLSSSAQQQLVACDCQLRRRKGLSNTSTRMIVPRHLLLAASGWPTHCWTDSCSGVLCSAGAAAGTTSCVAAPDKTPSEKTTKERQQQQQQKQRPHKRKVYGVHPGSYAGDMRGILHRVGPTRHVHAENSFRFRVHCNLYTGTLYCLLCLLCTLPRTHSSSHAPPSVIFRRTVACSHRELQGSRLGYSVG